MNGINRFFSIFYDIPIFQLIWITEIHYKLSIDSGVRTIYRSDTETCTQKNHLEHLP